MSMLDVLPGSSPGRRCTDVPLDGLKTRHVAVYP